MKKFKLVIPSSVYMGSRNLWWLIVPISLLDIGIVGYTGFELNFYYLGVFLGIGALFFASAMACRFIFKDEAGYLFGIIISQNEVMQSATGILCYLSALTNLPLTDPALISADHFFGFDWLAFIHWWDTQPPLVSGLVSAAYQTLVFQYYIMLVSLCLFKRFDQAQRYIIAAAVALLCTIALAAVFPAMGGFVYYDIDVDAFKHFAPSAGRKHEAIFIALRNHEHVEKVAGIVTFPSFHAAMAVIFMYSSLSFKYFRWLWIPLNCVMLVSCLTDGGHYLVDVIGGIVLALVGIWVAEKMSPRAPVSIPATPASPLVPAEAF